MNDIDFDEVEQNITPIDQEKKETKEESDDVQPLKIWYNNHEVI